MAGLASGERVHQTDGAAGNQRHAGPTGLGTQNNSMSQGQHRCRHQGYGQERPEYSLHWVASILQECDLSIPDHGLAKMPQLDPKMNAKPHRTKQEKVGVINGSLKLEGILSRQE